MSGILAVFLGGGVGSVARFVISKQLNLEGSWFSLGTFLANILSSLILGYLVGLSLKSQMSDQFQLLLMTGFCGGFSTFSTFSLENYNLLNEGNIVAAMSYTILSFIAGLLFIFIGVRLAGN